MNVVYTAPNRGHHYRYALALHRAGLLHKFVCGFSRFSPRAPFPEIGDKLARADGLQNVYLASLKLGAPKTWSDDLAYRAKIQQDRVSAQWLKKADVFLFYNGSGLYSCKKYHHTNLIKIVEAVNSHVDYQEQLLREEHLSQGLAWQPFHAKEKDRRMLEYEIADYILMPSEFVRKSFLAYGFPAEKLIKVPYGFNSYSGTVNSGSSTQLREPGAAFTILYVGSVSVRKGLRYLIDAFEQVRHPDKRLMIVGPKAMITGLEKVHIPQNVVFTGVLKGQELEDAYKQADVFCLPSIEEGLALVLGEALSYGIPVIATENTGASDILDDGHNGFIVPIRDAGAIAGKLNDLIVDEQLYRRIRNNALQKAQSLNGWEESGNLLAEALKTLI